MRIKSICLVAGVFGALVVSTTAQAALTGIQLEVKQGENPRLLICNLYVLFSEAGDKLVAVAGNPSPGSQLSYSTNSLSSPGGVLGFHQEVLPGFIGNLNFPAPSSVTDFFPNYFDDTYITMGVKAGFIGAAPPGAMPAHAGIFVGAATPGPTDWPSGFLLSDVGPGGSYFVTSGVEAVAGRVLIAQLVIDINAPTNDALLGRIDVLVPRIGWIGADGVTHNDKVNFAATHIPAPGTLALLGLAGLAGIRRRRR